MAPNKINVKLIFISLTITLILGCKNVTHNNLPNVYVDYTLDLDKPEYYELNTLGNFVYITGGVSGIIVYHDLDGSFKAYERACPYDFYDCGGMVSVTDLDKGIIKDTLCCGSEFSLTNDGLVLKGPAVTPLRQYKVYYYPNSNTLRITSY